MKRALTGVAFLSFLASGAEAAPAATCTLDRATKTTLDREPFLRNGWGLLWNVAANRVAYLQPDSKGYYKIFLMRPDGSERRRLTANHPELPDRHEGPVAWRPDGRFLLFAAQKASWSGRRLFGAPDYEALPGFGRHNDLWLIQADGARVWRLTDEPDARDESALAPIFSPDGKKVAWSARQEGGKYALKIADLIVAPEPHLANVRSYQPGGPAYYETGAFSSDGKTLFYASDQDSHSFWRSQIHALDLASGASRRLTQGDDYNEHPRIVKTPSGEWIVYMSTKNVVRRPLRLMLGTDWWAMKADGSAAKRLTTMNGPRENNPEFVEEPLIATGVTTSPAGDYLLGDVQDSLLKQTGFVIGLRLLCE
ncbi:MAG TPA: hypothetical protein VK446_09020 [Methylocystis sp.]|nr:hypothetical protein [Methylocystis sp.]